MASLPGCSSRASPPSRARRTAPTTRRRDLIAAARAALFAAACKVARTPALAALDAPDLTTCEPEIARLTAGGLSSRGIADRLGIAVRTVDNHLHLAYAKLGVGSRSGLAPPLLGLRHDA